MILFPAPRWLAWFEKKTHRLAFSVTREPATIDRDKVGPKRGHAFQEVSEKQIIKNAAPPTWMALFEILSYLVIFGIGFLFMSAVSFGWIGHDGSIRLNRLDISRLDYLREITPEFLIFGTIFLVLSIYYIFINLRALIFYLFLRPQQQLVIFDRETGVVTLPPVTWGKSETVPFHKLVVIWGRSGIHVYRSDRFKISLKLTGLETPGNTDRDWSFYVWYMDKNRPLPPGTAFDPYRARDDARRRGEKIPGFAHAGEGIDNVLSLTGPTPAEVEALLPRFSRVFAGFDEIEWVAFAGLVHHTQEHVDGIHLEIKTRDDQSLPPERNVALKSDLMRTLGKHLSHYRFLELVTTPRPRGKMIYSHTQASAPPRKRKP